MDCDIWRQGKKVGFQSDVKYIAPSRLITRPNISHIFFIIQTYFFDSNYANIILTAPAGVIKSRSRSKAHDTMFNQNPNVLLHTHWTYDKSWQEYYWKMGVTKQISMQSFSENWGLLFNAIHNNVLPLTHKEVFTLA